MGTCKTSFSLLRTAIECSKLGYRELNSGNGARTILVQYFHMHKSLGKQVSFNLSDIGEGIREVVVKEWFVGVGDNVKQFDNICEVQSDKASATITSRYDGKILKLYYKIDEIASVGKPLVDIDTENDDDDGPGQASQETQETPTTASAPITETRSESVSDVKDQGNVSSDDVNSDQRGIICLPSVRRLAKENGIDLHKVPGSGRNGRINKDDLLKYMESQKADKRSPTSSEDTFIEKIVPVTGFTKAMVKSMTATLKMPLFTFSDEISVKKLTALRKSLQAIEELSDIRISYMPFFIKALSNALIKYPIINSHYDEEKESIVYKRHHNVGVAMDTKNGLAIPVIKNVERLSILDISKELMRLMECGRHGSFSIQDLSDTSILISNVGSIGGTYVKPIPINQTSTIIGLGAIQVLPRFDSAMNCVPDEILALSCSADHRIIDGATMARFARIMKTQIENPHILLLNMPS